MKLTQANKSYVNNIRFICLRQTGGEIVSENFDKRNKKEKQKGKLPERFIIIMKGIMWPALSQELSPQAYWRPQR